MRIPLPKMMRHWREREFERASVAGDAALRPRPLGLLRQAAARSIGSRRGSRCACSAISAAGKGRFRYLPLAGGWTKHRDMPAPEGRTFQEL